VNPRMNANSVESAITADDAPVQRRHDLLAEATMPL
jgi:hypothetical protein